MTVSDEVKEKIKEKSMDLISFYNADTGEKEISKRNNVFQSKQVLAKGQRIEYEPGKKFKLAKDSIMVLIDRAPEFNWGHPCQQVYFDAETGNVLKTIDSIYPTHNYIVNPTEYEPMYTPVEVSETTDSGITEIPEMSEAVSNSSGERYAILFSGMSKKRHLNDLEHLYRILTQFYKYKEENIYILNHDGTLNFADRDEYSESSWNLWPGETTYDSPYEIQVEYQGTKTDLNTVLDTLKDKMQINDTLFLHVNGNGWYEPKFCFECYSEDSPSLFTASELQSKLESLPNFAVLIVMMEQCFSGGFATVISSSSKASKVHFSAACGADGISRGGSDFNIFAKEWTSAMRGKYPNGNGPENVIDMNDDWRICGTEAYDYAKTLTEPLEPEYVEIGGVFYPVDIPTWSEKTPGDGVSVFLGYPAHDLFIRDYVGDEGIEGPSDKIYSRSPDIIIYNNPLSDPIAILSSPDAMARNDLGEPVEFGQSNYIYLRVQNRGEFHSVSGKAKVYYARPSALEVPTSWIPIDENVEIPSIEPEQIGIVGPIEWDYVPSPGHYCFIALLQSGSDPEPDRNHITSRAIFHHYIAENNNAVWKNFNTVDMFEGGFFVLDFEINGWPSDPIQSDLRIDLTEFPPKTQVELTILRRLVADASVNHMKIEEETVNTNIYTVKPGELASLDEMELKRGDKSNAKLSVTLPSNIKHGYYNLTIQQVVDQKIMGEIVHMAAVGSHPFTANKNTNEVHKTDCPLVEKMKAENKVAYKELDRAIKHGYNGCIHCLEEYDTDKREAQIEIVKKILIENLFEDPTQIPEDELIKLERIEEEIVDTLKKAT